MERRFIGGGVGGGGAQELSIGCVNSEILISLFR